METNERQPMPRSTPHLILGISIIAIGVLLMLDNMGVMAARDYLQYWPVLLIVFGLSKMLYPHSRGGGMVLMIVGVVLLLNVLDVVSFHLWDLWPLLIVFVGFSMIVRSSQRRRRREWAWHSSVEAGSTISGGAFLGGVRRNSTSQDFKGGEVTAILGGCEIDLRGADIKNGDAVLDVFAFWGGINLKVPPDWDVVVEATPVLGGFDDKTLLRSGGPTKRLVIRGYAVMGGVEITN
jgi:predicted membrane protein